MSVGGAVDARDGREQTGVGLERARAKMRAHGVNPTAIEVFAHHHRELERGERGIVAESGIAPLSHVDRLESLRVDPAVQREALARTAVVKLNGGLGTSMGMTRAKSLLPVRDGRTFLDITVDQVFAARAKHGVRLPLIFMNSFSTAEDTRAALARHPELAVEGLPLDFIQSMEPKLRASDLSPVEWPSDPALEWCPAGHGDIYPALLDSGILDSLLDAGFRYICVSNSDNLGAAPSALLAGWFAGSGAPFAMEVCERTAMDRKGGHLAVRVSDGRLILREIAQTAPEDTPFFEDIARHRYFNTNTLWCDLEQLSHELRRRGGVLGLPLIRNAKTVDPRDPGSTPVIQIETAMGAAIEVFDGARAIAVPRSRFLPVKTTNELLLVRSDAYELDDDASLVLAAPSPPTVTLAPAHYARIQDFERRFPDGVPSLVDATALRVQGDWTFGAGVRVRGEAELGPGGGVVAAGRAIGDRVPAENR